MTEDERLEMCLECFNKMVYVHVEDQDYIKSNGMPQCITVYTDASKIKKKTCEICKEKKPVVYIPVRNEEKTK